MARITLADWSCQFNKCRSPLEGPAGDFTRFYGRIPASWIIAHKYLAGLDTAPSIRRTDQSYMKQGQVSLVHIHHLLTQSRPSQIALRSLNAMRGHGLVNLHDVGCWSPSLIGSTPKFSCHKTYPLPIENRHRQTIEKNWEAITQWLDGTPLQLLVHGELDLATPRDKRRQAAEVTVKMFAKANPRPMSWPDGLWASDGSMKPASATLREDRLVTCGVTGPQSIQARLTGRARSILQGEISGLIAAAILAKSCPSSEIRTIYTDHLNSARLVDDSKTLLNTESKLRHMNGRSYYRWLLLILQDIDVNIVYTKGHDNGGSHESRLNNEADRLAVLAHSANISDAPFFPDPTFTMDKFVLHSSSDSYIEMSTREYVTSTLIASAAADLATKPSTRMRGHLYDTNAHPLGA